MKEFNFPNNKYQFSMDSSGTTRCKLLCTGMIDKDQFMPEELKAFSEDTIQPCLQPYWRKPPEMLVILNHNKLQHFDKHQSTVCNLTGEDTGNVVILNHGFLEDTQQFPVCDLTVDTTGKVGNSESQVVAAF